MGWERKYIHKLCVCVCRVWMASYLAGTDVLRRRRRLKLLEFHGSSFLVASSWHSRRRARHARFPTDTSATSSRGCHEDATRKLLPWNLSYTGQRWIANVDGCRSARKRGLDVGWEGVRGVDRGTPRRILAWFRISSDQVSGWRIKKRPSWLALTVAIWLILH